MTQVNKSEFYNSFKERKDISTQASSSRVWIVTVKGTTNVIAKSVEDENGDEKFYIK